MTHSQDYENTDKVYKSPFHHGNFGRAFYSERISDFSQNYREINSFT